MPIPAGESSDGTRLVRGDFQARLFDVVQALTRPGDDRVRPSPVL